MLFSGISRRAVLPGAVLLSLGGLALMPGPGTRAAAVTSFTVGSLPQATGVQYSGGQTRNEDVEPGIAVDGGGTVWIGSNIDPNTTGDPRSASAISGADIWKSTDGGRSYQWVAAPFNTSGSTPGLGGEDSDLTAAPEKNSAGFYNVYATSLYIAASNLAISQDGGKSFTLMSLGGIPAQDRPWLSADGPCVFYLTYHQLPLFTPVVNKYDACNQADIGMGLALNPVQSTQIFLQNTAPGFTNGFNKPMVDLSPTSAHRHNIYVPMEACDLQSPSDFAVNLVNTAELIPVCPPGVNTYVEVAVSTDSGATFSVYRVATNSNGEQQVWPTSLAVDRAGVVYVAWSDNHNAFTSHSSDGGVTWSKALRVNVAPAATAIYPTLAAGPSGMVEMAYYGSRVAGDSNDATAMKTPGKPDSAAWYLYWTKSTDGGGRFTQQRVSGVLHTGVLCTMGTGCSVAGSRNLYDDFGIALMPTDARAVIAFDSDQPLGAVPAAANVDPFTAFATELPLAGVEGCACIGTLPAGQPGLANTASSRAAGSVAGGVAAVLLMGVAVRARRRPGAPAP